MNKIVIFTILGMFITSTNLSAKPSEAHRKILEEVRKERIEEKKAEHEKISNMSKEERLKYFEERHAEREKMHKILDVELELLIPADKLLEFRKKRAERQAKIRERHKKMKELIVSGDFNDKKFKEYRKRHAKKMRKKYKRLNKLYTEATPHAQVSFCSAVKSRCLDAKSKTCTARYLICSK